MRETKQHANLYYIFEADRRAHPMPPEQAKEIFKKIQKIFQNRKTFSHSGAP
ncbi:MAG: hypothetical protein J6R77_07820 [Clostridia bacterium]|nr:hypothetical protein [Clostridia bacterium]